MGSIDEVDDRTFRVNFTGDGADRLRDRVMDKLKEFMGDYTDDTLVEYVIVLLKNGRRKEEARNELNVFLGDDTDSFVSWLWDHLASNIDSYVQPEEPCVTELIKSNPLSAPKSGTNDSHHLDSESDRGKSSKESKIRHHREWKGLVRSPAEPPPLRSSGIENLHVDEKSHHKVRRSRKSPSPRPAAQRKRDRTDDRHNAKRETSQLNINAPRRLLQFAVRDAVAMSRPSNSPTEPSLKRLRSVVSTSTTDSSVVDRPRRIQSVARVPNPMSAVIKAVAEAAEDVTRVKSSGNVFDRLGRGLDVSGPHDQFVSYGEATIEDGEYGDVNKIQSKKRSTYLQRTDHSGQYAGSMTMLEDETGLDSDSMSEDEGYDDVNVLGRSVTDVAQSGTSAGNRGEDSMMVEYSVAKNGDDRMKLMRNKDQDKPAVASNSSQKIVNISVNVNAWKPPSYQEPREVGQVGGWKSVQAGDGGALKSGVRIMKDSSNPVNGNIKPAAESQKEAQKTMPSTTGYAAGRPLEDADSRTLFVSNVHFGATKDSLSRHFNKFGEVLKVVIITDAATGQPTGSAHVEFMRKEAADNALSLDGTSFMSRLLKVVRRSAAHQETPMMTWPRMSRGAPFATGRFPRVAFPRGSPSFRPRPLIKPGARSMQWKRDAQPSPVESGAQFSGNAVPLPAARSLTYVRTEPKPEANPGTT
ncbi:Splicing factor-like protein [Trema orientale]|uniref:Splicing factor-like protein n=1 Tax=Trema orientale TaxID=63057 RepID=A0A2P5E713_TREOI|nr:Splicing factor-like protein [Trema orientale]